MVRNRSWPAVSHYESVEDKRDAEEASKNSQTYNLELDTLSIELNCPNLEVYADGRDEGGGPGVVAESEE